MASRSRQSRIRSVFAKTASILGLFAALVLCAPCVHAQTDSMPAKTIDLDLNNAPIRQALNVLFQGAGLNYTVDPEISGYVTVNLRAVSFETALKAVLKSTSPPLVAVKDPDTGVYYVKIKDQGASSTGNEPEQPQRSTPPSPVVAGGAYPGSAAPSAEAVVPAYQRITLDEFETITLKYLPAEALSVIFSRMAIFRTRLNTANNRGNAMSFGGMGMMGGASTMTGSQMGGMPMTGGGVGQGGMPLGQF